MKLFLGILTLTCAGCATDQMVQRGVIGADGRTIEQPVRYYSAGYDGGSSDLEDGIETLNDTLEDTNSNLEETNSQLSNINRYLRYGY